MEIRKFWQLLRRCPGTCKAGRQVVSSAKLIDRAMEDGIGEENHGLGWVDGVALMERVSFYVSEQHSS